ncbi:ankyrin repeat-containing domain protein [Syncephalis fuscata]|nr:ankyrin repeat-containing domain protein [Syncephalis fuscata]
MPEASLSYPDATIRAFLEQNANNPAEALKNALISEAGFRQQFAQQPDAIACAILPKDELEKTGYGVVMPLKENERRKPGELAICSEKMDQFRRNWRLFTENSLENLNWNNVFVAGGAVNACLLPIPKEHSATYSQIRQYYHSTAYGGSDIDLFIYGLDEEQAKIKMDEIYTSVRDSIPWEVTCIRSKNVVTLVSQYPYRHIQIILRLYRSPAEVLMGFDVDCCSVGFDGKKVWALPRAREAFIRQQNSVDMTRRSPSYEVRLAKYAKRGFEIHVPGLDRQRIDPTIYERGFEKLYGLARLLVLEELATPEVRYTFLEKRREHRKRPAHKNAGSYAAKDRQGDLKALEADNNDYETVHLPYGPRWHAGNTVKQLYTKDVVLNSPWYTKNKGRSIKFHRHPCFFGTMEEVMNDCCGYCPDVTKLAEEDKPHQNELDIYVQGTISFIKDDPGRQAIGSFHPITDGDWSAEAYIKQPCNDLCAAASNGDLDTVKQLLNSIQPAKANVAELDGTDHVQDAIMVLEEPQDNANTPTVDVNIRDHVGRTPLQLAVLEGHRDVAAFLIDQGARICARVADGRTVLHLAAQQGNSEIIRLLLARSEENRKAKEARESAAMEIFSIDIIEKHELSDYPGRINWDQEADGETEKLEPEEIDDDIIDISVVDWDFQLTAMEHAVFYGNLDVVKVLIDAGADPCRVIKFKARRLIYYPLTLSMAIKDTETSLEVAKYLISKGARPTQRIIFHAAIKYGRFQFIELFISAAKNPLSLVNSLNAQFKSPLQDVVELLLKNGAKLTVLFTSHKSILTTVEHFYESVARLMSIWKNKPHLILTDLLSRSLPLGVDINKFNPIGYFGEYHTILDKIEANIRRVEKQINTLQPTVSVKPSENQQILLQLYLDQVNACKDDSYERYCWDRSYYNLRTPLSTSTKVEESDDFIKAKKKLKELEARRDYFISHNAKRYIELFPDQKEDQLSKRYRSEYGYRPYNMHAINPTVVETKEKPEIPQIFAYTLPNITSGVIRMSVCQEEQDTYYGLFNAVWNNDIATVKRLTSPVKHTSEQHLLHIGVYDQNSQSLLSIACLRGHAEMASLIIEIADKQYTPKVKSEKNDRKEKAINNYTLRIIVINRRENADTGDDDDDEDEDELQRIRDHDLPEVPYKPLVNHMLPKNLLTGQHSIYLGSILPDGWIEYNPNQNNGVKPLKSIFKALTPLQIAVIRGDLELVRALLNATKKLENGLDLDTKVQSDAVQALISSERGNSYGNTAITAFFSTSLAVLLGHEEIIDLFIEECAAGDSFSGVNIYRDCDEIDPETKLNITENYLGLNVDGKKKLSWINKHNPDNRDPKDLPLLHLAISANNHRSMAYLLSDRPTHALRRFAQKHPQDRRTSVLKTDTELEDATKRLIGVDSINKPTPIHIAVAANQPDALRFIIQHYQQLYIRPIYLAIANNQLESFDTLVEFGANPLATYKGWNIAHFAAYHDHHETLRHIASKVTADEWRQLMSSRATGCLWTPLAVAVAKSNLDATYTILELLPDSSALNIFDADCELPLHLAIKKQHSFIVGRLIEEIRTRQLWALLSVENGAGMIAHELTQQLALGTFCNKNPATPYDNKDIPSADALFEMKKLSFNPDIPTIQAIMTLVQPEITPLNISRKTIELQQLHELIKEAANDSRRLARMHYWSRQHDNERNMPKTPSHIPTFNVIWRIQANTQPLETDDPTKLRFCVPKIIDIYG